MLTPDSLFDPRPKGATALQPYSSFLTRCATAREAGEELQARLALGAYLLLRLVDRAATLATDSDRGAQEGFHWQLTSALRFIGELPKIECVEGSHLHGLVQSVADLERGQRPLRINLLAYSWHLEQAGRIEEALDAVAASAPFYADAGADDRMHLGMTTGRFHRTLARWELADQGYTFGYEAAEEQDNKRGMLLARLGRAKVLLGKGNLPESRLQIERIIEEASEKELADAKAWAYADLAVVLERMDEPGPSLRAQYSAFTHFRDSHDRLRVLGSLGVGLRTHGAFPAARRAFETVLRDSTDWHIRQNATIELMALHTQVGDELAFRRYKQELEGAAEQMPPTMAVDYRLRVAEGLIRFGRRAAGLAWLQQAKARAETNRLNDWYFRLERMIGELQGGADPSDMVSRRSESVVPEVAEVADKLLSYAGT